MSKPRILVAGQFVPTITDIRIALDLVRDLPQDRFVIVERAAQHFMQCLCEDTGWILEKREGDENHHFHALVAKGRRSPQGGEVDLMTRIFAKPQQPRIYLTFDEVDLAVRSYFNDTPEPDWLQWEPLPLPP